MINMLFRKRYSSFGAEFQRQVLELDSKAAFFIYCSDLLGVTRKENSRAGYKSSLDPMYLTSRLTSVSRYASVFSVEWLSRSLG